MLSCTADVIVVGAGPAGSTASFFLARSGVKVLMVDQATFPRDKTCGDGLGFYAAAMLEKMELLDWVKESGNLYVGCRISSPDGTTALTTPSAELQGRAYTLPRLALDAKLVETAMAAGAGLREGVRIIGMERTSPDRIRLVGQHNEQTVHFEAPLVIAADGGKVTFTRRLGLAPHAAEWVAVRAYYEGATGDPGRWEIHWEQATMPGYGWVFPMPGGQANVGIGAYSSDVQRLNLNLKALLDIFIEKNPHAQARLKHARRVSAVIGHPLRADAYRVTPFADNVLIAGEAAGVVNPLTGEGIAPSMITGQMAARYAKQSLERGVFASRTLHAYGKAFHKQFDLLQRSARFLRSMFSRPWILNRAIGRAAHDEDYACRLNDIVMGKDLPTEALKPGMALKMFLG